MTERSIPQWRPPAVIARSVALAAMLGAAAALSTMPAAAQRPESGLVDRAPRFLLLAPSAAPVRLDVTKTPMLTRRISVAFEDETAENALREIIARSGLRLMYSRSMAPLDRRVRLKAEDITVAAALTEVLLGANVDVVFTQGGRAMLVRRGDASMAAVAGTIVGTVREVDTNEPIGGATLTLDNSGRGVLSREDGTYRIVGVEPGQHTITARRLGFARLSRTVAVVSDSTITVDFELARAPTMLDEVVTTTTGMQRRVEIGNAISTIQADSVVAIAAVRNLSDVLTARAPGVQVFGTGGLTGASPKINVRGQNSLQLSNQPILIVDGVRVNNTPAGRSPDGAFIGVTAGRFDDISPNAIESIEIVKGPSAATLYGTDAANGVIVITTKRGAAGPPRWNVVVEGGIATFDPDRFEDNYYAWGRLPNGAQVNCTLQLVALNVCAQDSVTRFNPLKFGPTSPIGTGNRMKLGMDVSGGSSVRYFVSGAYENEVGYLEMPDVERATVETSRGALGIDDDELRPNGARKISVLANVSAPLGQTAELVTSATVLTQRSRIPHSNILAFSRGAGYRDANDGWAFGIRPSHAFVQRNEESATHATWSGTATWRPQSWLSTRATVGLDFSSTFYDALTRPGEGGLLATDITGYRGNTKTNVTLYTGDVGATATADVSSWLNSRTSIGAQYNRSLTLINSAQARGLTPGTVTVAGGARPSVSERNVEAVIAGGYLEQTFGVRERLFLTGAVRADGGSTFGRDFNTAIYPKASVSWLVPDVPGFSSLRVRAAYGASGVQPSSIAALASLRLFPAVVDGLPTTGALPSSIGNPDLKPERQREFEGGIDAELLEGRVRLELTGYDKLSTDALVNLPLGPSIGGGFVPTNVGSVRNRGFEWLVDVRPIARDALTWDVQVSGSYNDNELVSLGPGMSPAYGRLGVTSTVPGYPLFSYFDFPVVSYADANGNGILERGEFTLGTEPVFRGSSYPRTQFSVASSVTLFRNQVRVSALVDHRGSFLIANLNRSGHCFIGTCRAAVDRTAPLEEQLAVLAFNPSVPNFSLTNYLEDGSFTRLREMSITYQVPEAIVRRLRGRSASLTLAGRNLALWSKLRAPDPEVQSTIDGAFASAYVVEGGVPATRYWTLRLNLGL